MQNAYMHAAKLFLKHGKLAFEHTCFLNVFAAAAKVCSRCQGHLENVEVLATLLTTASDLFIVAISLTLWPFI